MKKNNSAVETKTLHPFLHVPALTLSDASPSPFNGCYLSTLSETNLPSGNEMDGMEATQKARTWTVSQDTGRGICNTEHVQQRVSDDMKGICCIKKNNEFSSFKYGGKMHRKIFIRVCVRAAELPSFPSSDARRLAHGNVHA